MVYPLKSTRFDGQMKARTYNFKYNNAQAAFLQWLNVDESKLIDEDT